MNNSTKPSNASGIPVDASGGQGVDKRLHAAMLLLCLFVCLSTAAAQHVRVENAADGLAFPEGPLWHPDGFLLFSDIHAGMIRQLKPGKQSAPWFQEGKNTNGLILSNDKSKIYACCNSDKELLEIDAKTKEFRVLVKEPFGKPLNDVNDAAVDPEGNVFFTDPRWGAKPEDIQGVYCYAADGGTTLAARMEKQPNGIVISPDKKWVYVGRHGGDDIWRFALEAGGKLADGRPWVQLEHRAGPDGMTVDSRGYVFVAQAGNGKICIISPDGRIVQTVQVMDRMATNCEFEGKSDTVLYVTGDGKLGQKIGNVRKVTFTKKPGS